MKLAFITFLLAMASHTYAKDVKDFNKVLIEGVQKEIKTENDQGLRTKQSIGRGPASVQETVVPDKDIKEESKMDKNFRQIGSKNW